MTSSRIPRPTKRLRKTTRWESALPTCGVARSTNAALKGSSVLRGERFRPLVVHAQAELGEKASVAEEQAVRVPGEHVARRQRDRERRSFDECDDPAVEGELALDVQGCGIAPFWPSRRIGATMYVRIAEIAPPWFTVPPSGYGGIELVVSLLTENLVEHGHDVTLFRPPGSKTKATLVSPLDAPDPAPRERLVRRLPRPDRVPRRRRLVRRDPRSLGNRRSCAGGPARRSLRRPHPARTVDRTRAPLLLAAPGKDLPGRDQRLPARRLPGSHYAATVHNGIDLESYPYREEKDDYLVYIGRATRQGAAPGDRGSRAKRESLSRCS